MQQQHQDIGGGSSTAAPFSSSSSAQPQHLQHSMYARTRFFDSQASALPECTPRNRDCHRCQTRFAHVLHAPALRCAPPASASLRRLRPLATRSKSSATVTFIHSACRTALKAKMLTKNQFTITNNVNESELSTVTLPVHFFPNPCTVATCQKRVTEARNVTEMAAFQCASARRSPLETVPPPQEIRAAQGATCTGRYVSNRYKNRSSRMARRASH